MNLKYMKVSLFEISYMKKLTFSPYYIFLDIPVLQLKATKKILDTNMHGPFPFPTIVTKNVYLLKRYCYSDSFCTFISECCVSENM